MTRQPDGAGDAELVIWEVDEGTQWARGHGPEVEAALLLARSAAR